MPISQWAKDLVRVLTAVGIIPSMMRKRGWRVRLEQIVAGPPKLDMKAISLRAGLGATFLRDVLEKGRTPSVENFVAISEALGVSPLYLIYGDKQPRITIPIVGIVSAGEGWISVDEGQLEPVEFIIDHQDTIGIEVRGDSMSPVYRNGDFLIGDRHHGPYLDNLIGLDCVVMTAEGSGYVKILRRGGRLGRYNLKSYNPTFDDIENVQVAWAAPIRWIRRRHR